MRHISDTGPERVSEAETSSAALPPQPLGTVTGSVLLAWGQLCLAELTRHREEINALNVFPIADSDTGTNLLATMAAAVSAAQGAHRAPDMVSAHRVALAMTRGAAFGARGNSGILLSQLLRGFAEATRPDAEVTPHTLRSALVSAAALVRESLSVPVEGTMLTALDYAADYAARCADSSLVAVTSAAARGAADALGESPTRLRVLREAGVVDAGARGLLVVLDCLVGVVRGKVPDRPEYPPATRADGAGTAPAAPHYEVMFVLQDTDTERVDDLRRRLAELGDSVVVVRTSAQHWSVHVHSPDAGAAVQAGLAAGALSEIRIEVCTPIPTTSPVTATSTTAPGNPVPAVGETTLAPQRPDRGILVVATGAGARSLFRAAGAAIVDGAGGVTTDDLLAALAEIPHREVLVLPNGALPAQELVAVGVAARNAQREVLLLPSGSMVQGLAALAVHDPERIAVDDAFAMSEAAAGTRWGSVRTATERALTMVGTCEPGEGLGLVGHDVVVIDAEVAAAGRTLLDRMLGLGGELVTLLVGAGAPDELAPELRAHICAHFPGVEVIVYAGGQHGELIQIGVE